MKKIFLSFILLAGFALCFTGCKKDKEDDPIPETEQVETPVFEPGSGNYQDSVTVTLTCATEGASIYYTIDGTEPDNTSTIYSEPVKLYESTTLKARAYKDNYNPSEISSAEYTIILPSNTFIIENDTCDINVSELIKISFGTNSNLDIVMLASDSLQTENNNAIFVIYYDGIETGTIDITPTNNVISFLPLPKVIAFKDCNITETLQNISNCNITEILQNISNLPTFPNIYTGLSGSLTLEKSGETYTITTANMMLHHNNEETTGAIDFQGTLTITPLTVGNSGSFSLNEENYIIPQAGTIHYNFMETDLHLMVFFPIEMNKVIAIVIGDEILSGTFHAPITPLLFIDNFNISTMQGDLPLFAMGGTIVIEKQESNIYHVTITNGKFNDITLNLEYTGTIPEFNFN